MAVLSLKNGTSTIPGATVKGNFNYFSGGTRALGPTSVTGFYSGYDAPAGGYTVYKTYGGSDFSATVATNNTELNYILIQMGGTGTTVEQNIIWATNTPSVFITTPPVYTYTLYNCCAGYSFPCDSVTLYSQSPSIVIGTQFYDNPQLTSYVSCNGPGQIVIQSAQGSCNSGIINDAIFITGSGLVTSVSEFMDCIP
jgi:hypothetical protein